MIETYPIEVAGETLHPRGDRTLYLPEHQTLLLADLHLGKAETLQAHGLAVPSGTQADDLTRLGAAARETRAQAIVVLGDMVHARAGLTESVVQSFAAWRQTIDAELVLVRGNHDRVLAEAPPEWRLEIVPEALPLGNLLLRHHPDPAEGFYVLAGHLHPVAKLGNGRGDALRLPCFSIGPDLGILPAFTTLAGGSQAPADPAVRCLVTAMDCVIEIIRRN